MAKEELMTKEEFVQFNTEMARLKAITWKGYEKTLKEVGVSYLSAVAISAKLAHSLKYSQVATLGIYLAPSTESGFNVCPNSDYCRDNCLSGSGHNRLDRISKKGSIDRARVIKTRLFFANKPIFMQLLIHEIKREMKKAEIRGQFFAIRLNCTSDINPESFVYNGKNILQIFPKVVFYDYTKVENRLKLVNKYTNYDVTWSIDGSRKNLQVGLDYLDRGGRVAVVYGTSERPKTWYEYPTCDGDLTDYRISDPEQVCMLKFKKTANNYVNGEFKLPNTKFIVKENDPNCEW